MSTSVLGLIHHDAHVADPPYSESSTIDELQYSETRIAYVESVGAKAPRAV